MPIDGVVFWGVFLGCYRGMNQNYLSIQFSSLRPGIRPSSLVLLVTKTRRLARAVAAIIGRYPQLACPHASIPRESFHIVPHSYRQKAG